MKIKEIPLKYRPREKLEKEGVITLSDSELLAIILKTGSNNQNVVELSNNLIYKHGLEKLNNYSLKELQKIKGIGYAKACQIISLFEFSKRYKFSRVSKIIKCSKDVFNYCKPLLENKKKEYFMVLYLDTRNNVVKHEIIFIGTVNSSVVHPREIFKTAVKESVCSIILVHNHPSGDPSPSPEDVNFTKVIFEAGELMNINVLDHIIIGDDYFSFKDNNLF